MIITDDLELWQAMAEYHDHGHDHLPNPGGRGGEGRRFVGSNYRMMELQGAIGLAQLAKLDQMLASQRRLKERLKEAAKAIPAVTFRELVDEKGDSATFFAFMLSDAEHCRRVQESLRQDGCAAIHFAENTWHYYPRWEHLLAGKTLTRSGYPFYEADGRRRVVYDPALLPRSAAIMERTLVYQIMLKTDEERLATICRALAKAATV